MKAIQVLKNCLKYSDYGNDIEEKEYIRKAIAELEALENRSCEKCKHCRQFAELALCDILRGYTNMNLIKYCGRYEPKQ